MEPSDKNPTSPGESRGDVLLREALYIVEPLARLLVAQGVTYPGFAQALKRVFLDAAESELADSGRKITDSALSLLSGVHRKDVRTLGTRRHGPPSRATSIADQVVQRWISQPGYINADGVPVTLPIRARTKNQPSFEQLAQSVSKDFHARSVLDELERLGVVQIEDGHVRIVSADGFVPGKDDYETLRIFGANVRDHVAAARENLLAVQGEKRPPFLEYSVWADGLHEDSARDLARFARKNWFNAMRRVTDLALQLSERDRTTVEPATAMRFRFGGFTYHARMTADETAGAPVSDPSASTKDSAPSGTGAPAHKSAQKA